jgi:hypothetical protein
MILFLICVTVSSSLFSRSHSRTDDSKLIWINIIIHLPRTKAR